MKKDWKVLAYIVAAHAQVVALSVVAVEALNFCCEKRGEKIILGLVVALLAGCIYFKIIQFVSKR